MTIKTISTCPLGHTCEEVKDGAIHRCAWFTELEGTNPNNGAVMGERACAIRWMPLLTIENSQQQRSTAAAVESFRNEMMTATEQSRQTAITIARLQLNLAPKTLVLPVAKTDEKS